MSILSWMIAWVEKAKYWLSREYCYDEMEEKRYTSQGRCCGLMGGDNWSDNTMYMCIDCPHYTPIVGWNMKRLTEYTIPETGFSVVSKGKYKQIMMDEKPSVEKIYNRLKKIEDILGDEYELDRLRKLVEADRDGRCGK